MFNAFSKCRKYGLEDDTVDFIGHALALHRDDSYLDEPAKDFVDRVKVLIYKLFRKLLYSTKTIIICHLNIDLKVNCCLLEMV